MRFRQLDRIVELQAGKRLVALKKLTGAEDYLRDHFPHFPVMPGVLMLEALFQASMWLVLASEQFEGSVVALKEARNVKFADFVEPGEVLTVTTELLSREGNQAKLKAQGVVGDSVAVSGRLVLDVFKIAERYPQRGGVDGFVRRDMKQVLEHLQRPV